jgi:Flp pilus assembly pilin Flp
LHGKPNRTRVSRISTQAPTMHRAKTFWQDDRGTTAIEYALIASLASIAILVAADLVGINVAALFQKVADGFASVI